jgi:hypothetical protein
MAAFLDKHQARVTDLLKFKKFEKLGNPLRGLSALIQKATQIVPKIQRFKPNFRLSVTHSLKNLEPFARQLMQKKEGV